MAAERWVVYSTFDSAGAAAPFAEEQLDAYRQLGFQTLVVDTSPVLSAQRAAGWDRSSTAWLRRENTGYDFGSYRHGLTVLLDERKVPAAQLDLLLTNDSCYGPYTPLADVFRAFDAAPRDARRVFGMTDSDEIERHLQSYWLYFRSDVVHHAIHFLGALASIQHRQDAVELGEVGFSHFLLERGCALIPHRSADDVVRHFAGFHGRWLSLAELALRWRTKRPRYTRVGDRACLHALLGRPFLCNPPIAFGTHLHFQSMLPFLKRQLVRENPNSDPFVPASPPADPRDNACVDRWLRDTRRYRQRYGA